MGILIFKGLTAWCLYKLFGVKGLILTFVQKKAMKTIPIGPLWHNSDNVRITHHSPP
jgi:hypothetical protein